MCANPTNSEQWDGRAGREKCCDEDLGGSHYHCGNCGGVSSMYGHYVQVENFKGFLCGPPKRRIERRNGKSYAVEVKAS